MELGIKFTAGVPLRRQLEQALRVAIRSGRLAPGSVLPSSRDLAEELGVSRGVVVDSYAQLAAEGYLSARRGSGTRVAFLPEAAGPPVRRQAEAARAVPVQPRDRARPTSMPSRGTAGRRHSPARCASYRIPG